MLAVVTPNNNEKQNETDLNIFYLSNKKKR